MNWWLSWYKMLIMSIYKLYKILIILDALMSVNWCTYHNTKCLLCIMPQRLWIGELSWYKMLIMSIYYLYKMLIILDVLMSVNWCTYHNCVDIRISCYMGENNSYFLTCILLPYLCSYISFFSALEDTICTLRNSGIKKVFLPSGIKHI